MPELSNCFHFPEDFAEAVRAKGLELAIGTPGPTLTLSVYYYTLRLVIR